MAHQGFNPQEHIPANWKLPTPESDPVPTNRMAKALTIVAFLMMIPALGLVVYFVLSRVEPTVERTAGDFEKNLKPFESGSSHPAGDAPKTEESEPVKKMTYTTGNVSMEMYRKEGYAVHEKPKKKDDFLGAPVNESGSTDLEDRAKGPGGPDPNLKE